MRAPVARRLYRLALRLLPDPIRRKHGDAMEALFVRQLEVASRRGTAARVAATARGLWDVLARAGYERTRWRRVASPGPSSDVANPIGTSRPTQREPLMASLFHDIRSAARTLLRSPRFTLLAVLTLALGIGANVALFSVVYGVVLRPLPFPEPERVSHLAWDRGGSVPRVTMPAYKVQYWTDHSRAFEAITTWRASTLRVGEEDRSEPVGALRVTHEFLDVVGWSPALGRAFEPGDDRPGAPDVAVLGHDLWRTRYAADPGIVGRTVQVQGTPHSVIGVLPEAFEFPQDADFTDLLVPLRLEPDPLNEGENWAVLARLAPGVDRTAAEADLARVYEAFRTEHPELMNGTDRAMVLASWQSLYLGGTRTVLWALMGATALVLLIACANVGALLLARGSARKGELAVRTALGAGRGRIVRQLLAESLLLAAGAALAGLALAHVWVDALLGLYPGTLPRAGGVGLNGAVMAYAVLAAVATGVVFGMVAAVPVLRGAVASSLRESTRGGTGRGGLRRAVLAVEAAVSMVLLVGAGLLVATLAEVRSVDPGFAVDGVLAAPLPVPPGGWESEGGMRQVDERVRRELAALPGVTAVASASTWPLRRGLNIPVGIQGRPEDFEGAVEWRSASPGYLEALDVPLLRGRGFTEADGAGAPPVALVNEAFAARYFPDGNVLGQRIEIGRYRDRYIDPVLDVGGVEVVGVVGDVREIGLKVEPRRTVIVPAPQVADSWASPPVVLVRHRGDGVRAVMRDVLAGVAGGAAPVEVRSMREVVGASLASERFNALLMGVFALVALVLTAFGIYGVVSYGVRQRTREIGIRMALGADRGRVARQVLGQGMAPVMAGLLVGTGGALLMTRFIESLLWGVEPGDPLTIGAVAVVLATVAAVATWLPMREATGIDPNRSLRPE